VTFDVPGAGTGPGQGTTSVTINAEGAVAGWYMDANNATHGFLRTPGGDITPFDAPGAGTASGQGTIAGGPRPGIILDHSEVASARVALEANAITRLLARRILAARD